MGLSFRGGHVRHKPPSTPSETFPAPAHTSGAAPPRTPELFTTGARGVAAPPGVSDRHRRFNTTAEPGAANNSARARDTCSEYNARARSSGGSACSAAHRTPCNAQKHGPERLPGRETGSFKRAQQSAATQDGLQSGIVDSLQLQRQAAPPAAPRSACDAAAVAVLRRRARASTSTPERVAGDQGGKLCAAHVAAARAASRLVWAERATPNPQPRPSRHPHNSAPPLSPNNKLRQRPRPASP